MSRNPRDGNVAAFEKPVLAVLLLGTVVHVAVSSAWQRIAVSAGFRRR